MDMRQEVVAVRKRAGDSHHADHRFLRFLVQLCLFYLRPGSRPQGSGELGMLANVTQDPLRIQFNLRHPGPTCCFAGVRRRRVFFMPLQLMASRRTVSGLLFTWASMYLLRRAAIALPPTTLAFPSWPYCAWGISKETPPSQCNQSQAK